ncbi:MAG: hypothetical protein C5B48_14505 [Candidatus Rokuibacteriota bacterium]|nr:MAG: hypothetical protein C5B48_14505 [Candidatus Rokubacteria bacterium]
MAAGRRYVAGGVAVLLMVLGLSAWASPSPTNAPNTLGVYRGASNPAGVKQFARWLGHPAAYALDFVPAKDWQTISNPGGLGVWHKGCRCTLVLGVPLIPYSGGTLKDGAAGAYDGYFRQLARKLRRIGLGNAILRLGWEFSGDWYPWSVHDNEQAVEFAGYWRHVVRAMRGVSPALRFDWNPAHGWRPFDINRSYPGNAYVDYIGLDVYDQGWQPDFANPQVRWADLVNGDGGLAWHRSFARQHGKPMSFPEWGLSLRSDGHGGGDDPYFIDRMHDWFVANRIAYQIYFEFDAPDGEHRLMVGHFPNGAEAFRERFGNDPSPRLALRPGD